MFLTPGHVDVRVEWAFTTLLDWQDFPISPNLKCTKRDAAFGIGQRLLMGETEWEKGVETASCDFCGFLQFPALFCSFLRLQTTYLADQGPHLQTSAKIFDKLPFLPFKKVLLTVLPQGDNAL